MTVSIRLGVAAALVLISSPVFARGGQSPFGYCGERSWSNALILIPASPSLHIQGEALEPGDEVAALAPDGTCTGHVRWTGSGAALTVWADDPMTPDLDGLQQGDPITLAVFDRSEGVVHEGAEVTAEFSEGYGSADGFAADALFILAEADAEEGPAPTIPAVAMGEAYPNPTAGQTRLPFHLDAEADVTVEVFDALGRRVEVIIEDRLGAGEHTATFDATGSAGGVYLYRLRTGAAVFQRQVVVTR